MASTARSNVLEALKYGYGSDRVEHMANEEIPIYNILSKVKKDGGGRGMHIIPILVQNAGAFTGIAEGGALPAGIAPDTQEAVFDMTEYVGLYELSWKLIQDARTSKFAFQTAVQVCDGGLRRKIFRHLNSDFMGTGKGELFTITGADASTVVTSYYLPRVMQGDIVDVMDLSDDDAKVGDSLTVQAVDPVNKTVDLSGALTGEAAGDYGVLQDTTDANSGTAINYHTNGLLGIIDSANPATVVGNYGGINRSTAGNEFWQSVELTNGGTNRPLSEDLLLQAMDQARVKGNGKITHWLSNLSIVQRYHEILAAERFFALSRPGTLSGGIGREKFGDGKDDQGDGRTPYEFSGIPWHVDPYFTNNTILGLNTDELYLLTGENDTPRPISEIFEGQSFFRETSNATYEVAWYYQCEVVCPNPSSQVKIADVSEA